MRQAQTAFAPVGETSLTGGDPDGTGPECWRNPDVAGGLRGRARGVKPVGCRHPQVTVSAVMSPASRS